MGSLDCRFYLTWLFLLDGIWRNSLECVTSLFGLVCFKCTSLLTQYVVSTSFQRHLNVGDVRWTLKQRHVLSGLDLIVIFGFYAFSLNMSHINLTKIVQPPVFYDKLIILLLNVQHDILGTNISVGRIFFNFIIIP